MIIGEQQRKLAIWTATDKTRRVNRLLRLISHPRWLCQAAEVTLSSKGAKTPGIDGITKIHLQTNLNVYLNEIRNDLLSGNYQPMPARRIYIPKANGKKRPLGIPTMRDRAMQALYALALNPIAETLADHNSYGFRPKRSAADAIGQCFCALAKKSSAKWVLEADIKACFDNISHEWLMRHVTMDKGILNQWLKSGYMENALFHSTVAGTPQGGNISPIYANMALDGLEAEVK